MWLTEEEALKKLCPFARTPNEDLLCAGSDCMAWRKSGPPREVKRFYEDAPDHPDAVAGGEWRTYKDGWRYEVTDWDRDGRKFDVFHRPGQDDGKSYGYCALIEKETGCEQ